jgi:phenylalanyl-tRNA synthetase beta chain
LGLLLAGARQPPHWSARARKADVFDAIGLIQALAERLGLPGLEVRPGDDVPGFLHPGQSAGLWSGGARTGSVGAVHPDQAAAGELKDDTIVAELDLEPLLAPCPAVRVRPLPRFPGVVRDLSVVVGSSMTAAALEAAIRAAGGERLRAVEIADRYEGAPLAPGTVSLTVTLTYQDPARTLTGDEVQASLRQVMDALRAQGCEIRGE